MLGDPVHEPRRDLLGVDVELVSRVRGILFGLVSVYLVDLLDVHPVVFSDVK